MLGGRLWRDGEFLKLWAVVFFDVAYRSYLPALIPRTDLIEGNTKLQVTGSVAQMAGPARASGFF